LPANVQWGLSISRNRVSDAELQAEPERAAASSPRPALSSRLAVI